MGYDALRVTVIGGNPADFAALKLDRSKFFLRAIKSFQGKKVHFHPSLIDRND